MDKQDTTMTERTPHSLSEKIIHYDTLVEENEKLKGEIKELKEQIHEVDPEMCMNCGKNPTRDYNHTLCATCHTLC